MGMREIKERRNDVGGPIIGPIISGAWRVHTVNIIQIHTYTHILITHLQKPCQRAVTVWNMPPAALQQRRDHVTQGC